MNETFHFNKDKPKEQSYCQNHDYDMNFAILFHPKQVFVNMKNTKVCKLEAMQFFKKVFF